MQVPCRSRVETANARKGCAHSFPSLSFEQTYKSPSFICRLKLLVSPLLLVYFVFPQYSLQKLAFVFSFKQKLDRHCFSVIIYGVNTIFILPPPPLFFFSSAHFMQRSSNDQCIRRLNLHASKRLLQFFNFFKLEKKKRQ